MSEPAAAAANIFERLVNSPCFHPAHADLFTDWNLQAGDIVTVKSGSESYAVPVHNMKLKWSGAPRVTVEATGNPVREQPSADRRRTYSTQSMNHSEQMRLQNKISETAVTVTDMGTRVTAAELEINGLDAAIALKASSADLTALGTRVTSAELDIDGLEGEIALKVSRGSVATSLSVELGNGTVSGGNLIVSGYVTASELETSMARIETQISEGIVTEYLISDAITSTGSIAASSFRIGAAAYSDKEIKLGSLTSGHYLGRTSIDLDHYHNISASESDGVITLTLGQATGSNTPATFNIAGTRFYQEAVESAYERGRASVAQRSITGDYSPSPILLTSSEYGSSVSKSITLDYSDGDSDMLQLRIDASRPYAAGQSSVTLSGSWNGTTYTAAASNGESVSTTLGTTYVYPRGNSVTVSNYTRTAVETCGTGHRVPLTLSGPNTIVDEDGYVWRNMYYCSNWDTLYEKKTSYYFDDDGTESTYYRGASRQTYYTIPS